MSSAPTGGAEKWRQRAGVRPPGLHRFLEVYRQAHFLPYSPSDSEVMAGLQACLNCGTCLGVCPVIGAAAGRAYPGPRAVAPSLARSLTDLWTSADIVGLCTTCMACEEACPADVPVYRAILMARAKNFEERARDGQAPLPGLKRRVVDFFAQDQLARAARWGATLQGLAFTKTATGEMRARLPIPLGPFGQRLLPPLAHRSLAEGFPAVLIGEAAGGPRVAVFAGCLGLYAYTDTSRSLVRVLLRHCREVIVPAQQVCCGAPALTSGDLPTARRLALENAAVFEAAGVDFVVTACATCGDILRREYPRLALAPAAALADGAPVELRGSPTAAGTALVQALAAKTRDVHAFLTGEVRFRVPAGPAAGAVPGRTAGRPDELSRVITLHDPCHLARGQGLAVQVRELAQAIPGVELREMEGAGVCCGGAGSFALDHYELALAIRDRKVSAIGRTGAGTVITGCPSCRMHIADGLEKAGLGQPVRHLVDLLDQAYQGEE